MTEFLHFGTRLRQQLIYLSAEIGETQEFAPNVEEAILSFARAVLAEGGRILLTTSDLELVDLLVLTAGEYQQSEPAEEKEPIIKAPTEAREAPSVPQAAPILFLPSNGARANSWPRESLPQSGRRKERSNERYSQKDCSWKMASDGR